MALGIKTYTHAPVAKEGAMKEGNLDKLVMLFSTDWFLPYWFRLKISMKADKQALFQQGCRDIIRQIMSGAKEYWHVSFAEERLKETYCMFEALLQKCEADTLTIDRINALIEGVGIPQMDEATGWLVLTITEQLLGGSLTEGRPLNATVRDAIENMWKMVNRPDFRDVDFARLSLDSRSNWDGYIRSITPDLPTRLSDYVSGLATKNKFELFWGAINAHLSSGERRELLNWYRSAAEALTGEPLRLPQEV